MNGTNGWGNKQTSSQYWVKKEWQAYGSKWDAHGWAYIEYNETCYYLIATGQFFGNVGDFLIVTLENGDTYPCIMADAKGRETEEYAKAEGYPNYGYFDSKGRHLGHWYYEAKQLNVMELLIGPQKLNEKGKWVPDYTEIADGETLKLSDLGQVASITNGGSIFNLTEPVEVEGVTYTSTKGATVSSSGTTSFSKKFKQNALGAIISLILDGLRTIGDGIQAIINCIQNSTLHIGIQLMYSYSELSEDVGPETDNDGAGNKNSYTNVGGYVSGGSDASDVKSGQIGVDVDEAYFGSDTEIPVITVDFYDFAVNDINFLDINYLTGNLDHDDGSPWMVIRNFAVSFINITFYISAILLITMLVIFGVSVVKFSLSGIDNPKKQLDNKNGINKFITSVCMLIGTIVITSLCIFGTEALCEFITVDSVNNGDTESEYEYELPIRVHVSSAGYSFSTNFTGYARYMTQIDDVDAYGTKAIYTFVYLMFVVLNVIGLVFMLFRMFALYCLAIYGPITVVMYMFSKDSDPRKVPDSYKNWAKLYLMICLTQLIFALAYRATISWVAD